MLVGAVPWLRGCLVIISQLIGGIAAVRRFRDLECLHATLDLPHAEMRRSTEQC